MLKKEKLNFNEGLQQYRLALEYKSYGADIKAIEILKKVLYNVDNIKKTPEEIHLLSIVEDSLATVYMEMENLSAALYYFNKSISSINTLLSFDHQNINLHKNQALQLINMAHLYWSLGEHDKSLTYSQKAIEQYELFTKLNVGGASLSLKDEINRLKSEIINSKPIK